MKIVFFMFLTAVCVCIPVPGPVFLYSGGSGEALCQNRDSNRTVLGIRDTRFTLNDTPTFLLGISYYGVLGASKEFILRDLDDMQSHGFNWLRVWATWNAFGEDISAVDTHGNPREPYIGTLEWLVAECDGRGMVVDVTLTRGDMLPDFAAHRRAVETLVTALKDYRNWYIDLANEHDIRDARFASDEELTVLRDRVRDLDSRRLVTASFGGHDLSDDDIGDALCTIGLDFLCPHRPREAGSPDQTESRTRKCFAMMKSLGCSVPIHYQEPFRRGFGSWEPLVSGYLRDLRGALAGGAAGWCLHNGSTRSDKEERPRRSFDLRERRLFDQLDDVERSVVNRAARQVRRAMRGENR